ncbi:MAG: DUF2993 domain-containing protein [Actinomycetes bacterium]
MDSTRAKDWLAGATAMLVVLAAGVATAWWMLTTPADEGARSPGGPGRTSPPPDGRPPADLAADEVWLADLHLRSARVVTADSQLRRVRATGRDVVTGPEGLVAGRVAVEVTVPFHVVAAELGGDTVVGRADEGQARVLRTVEVLGRELRVAATGTVEVSGGRLVVEPRAIDLGGPQLLSEALAAVVRELVTITHEIEGLPEGLVLQEVGVRDDGFRARLRGADVRLLP